jgi:hypothetical protein
MTFVCCFVASTETPSLSASTERAENEQKPAESVFDCRGILVDEPTSLDLKQRAKEKEDQLLKEIEASV